jgi:hypothetical protein
MPVRCSMFDTFFRGSVKRTYNSLPYVCSMLYGFRASDSVQEISKRKYRISDEECLLLSLLGRLFSPGNQYNQGFY